MTKHQIQLAFAEEPAAEDRVAIVGSRSLVRLECVAEFVRSLPAFAVVITGGAKGVDCEAERAARARGLDVIVHLPDWKKHGRAAGMRRNALIVESCTRLVAFWNGTSSGTLDSIRKARAAGKPCEVRIIEVW